MKISQIQASINKKEQNDRQLQDSYNGHWKIPNTKNFKIFKTVKGLI